MCQCVDAHTIKAKNNKPLTWVVMCPLVTLLCLGTGKGSGMTYADEESEGHVGTLGVYEYFTHHESGGDLYRAPLYNPVVNGYRQGARWQCPAHMADEWWADRLEQEAKLAEFFEGGGQ